MHGSTSSRIQPTHKTYKNKINNNSNKADLWKKINESFDIDIDKLKQAYYSMSIEDIELIHQIAKRY
jgi:hypothetical protein